MLTPRNHRLGSRKTKFRVQTSHRALYRAGLGGLVAMLLLALVLPYIPYVSDPFSPVRRVEAADTITVTTTADTVALDGQCSLREAIVAINTNITQNECTHDGSGGLDTILFNILGTAPFVITLNTELPDIIEPVNLNASAPITRLPTIVLDGENLPDQPIQSNLNANGFTLAPGSDGSTIQGFVIQDFPNDGILILSSSNHTIIGNRIGTNFAGTAAAPNRGRDDGAGIELVGPFANNNTIGGTVDVTVGGSCTGDCNLISGNAPVLGFVGLKLRDNANNNTVIGNYIGSDVTGTLSVPNERIG
ncbi:MAG: CSLREA domain-containing protein, partial [Anaerolineae bacterium]